MRPIAPQVERDLDCTAVVRQATELGLFTLPCREFVGSRIELMETTEASNPAKSMHRCLRMTRRTPASTEPCADANANGSSVAPITAPTGSKVAVDAFDYCLLVALSCNQ
jgi:hypothetical protein